MAVMCSGELEMCTRQSLGGDSNCSCGMAGKAQDY